MFTFDKGIRLDAHPIWIDASNVVQQCCVSHGHADHIRRHKLTYATPATAAFIRRRLGDVTVREIPFDQSFQIGPYSITFLPAGHILGSAQVYVEHEDGTTLLYSGDFKLETGRTAEPLRVRQADILIMECTFGYPKYRFPGRDELEKRLCQFVEQALSQGQYPLVYGYALGKAQEAMKILADHGFELAVHGSVLHMAEVYQRYGVDFGKITRFRKNDDHRNKVIILPPQARHLKMIRALRPSRSIFLSGWGVDSAVRFRYGVDEVLPLSDHADFDGLLRYIDMVQPKTIYTTHGPKDYYLFLRSLGYNAHPLKPSQQGELF